jgi:hypothetical protein
MLAATLPGLRDLRAPLAAGYLWLLALYLLLVHHVPTHEHATGVLADLYALAKAVGRPGLVAASAFIAYVLGTLSLDATAVLLRAIHRLVLRVSPTLARLTQPYPLRRARTGRFRTDAPEWFRDHFVRPPVHSLLRLLGILGSGGERTLTNQGWRVADYLVDRLLADVETDWTTRGVAGDDVAPGAREDRQELGAIALAVLGASEERAEGRRQVARLLQLELGGIKLAAMTTAPQIYAEVDRLDAEQAFRSALLIPTAALAVAIGRQQLRWALVAFAVSAILAIQGLRRGRDASSVLVEALDIGALDAPVLERLRRKALSVQPIGDPL